VKEGHDGLVRAKAARPELILLDMMCANLEGTAILDRLKKAPVTKSMRWLSSQARLKKKRGRRVSGKVSLVLDGDGRSLLTDYCGSFGGTMTRKCFHRLRRNAGVAVRIRFVRPAGEAVSIPHFDDSWCRL
jgi:hypothetical protein